MTLPRIKVGEARIGIANLFARMPFRFGVVTMNAAASATLELEVFVDGRRVLGYASDFLSYKWFDKRPEKSPADNVEDLLWVLNQAAEVARDLPEGPLFRVWQALDVEVDHRSVAAGFNRLGASFGVSMIERGMIDALGRATGQSFNDLLRSGAMGLDPGAAFPELAGMVLADSLPPRPIERVALRHTVGLVDPLSGEDLARSDRIGDGLPETLDDYLRDDAVRYLKLKLSGNADADIARFERIATLIDRQDRAFGITIDGNEQFQSLPDFAAFVDRLRTRPALSELYQSTLFVEQPLDRAITLDTELDDRAMHVIGKPMMIDEADGWTGAYRDATALGYRGVSHKNCKGVIRSLLNAMLAAHKNRAGLEGHFQSAEDLTCLPVISLQSNLTVVAALGIGHAECNGHHYFNGLRYLPPDEAAAALAAHPELYRQDGDDIRLAVHNGELDLRSLQVPGMGFSVLPDMDKRIDPADWAFAMLNRP